MSSGFSLHVLPIIPAWAIAAVVLVLLGLLAHGSRLLLEKKVPPRWVGILAGLRVASIVLFAICLLQPIVSYTRRVSQLPEMLVLVDSSKSMALPVGMSSGEGQGKSRLDDVRSALSEGDLSAALRDRFRTHWFAFDRQALPLSSGNLSDVQPQGEATRFADSLQSAWNELRLTGATQGAAAPRVLLASDGNDLGNEDVVETARRLGIVIDTLVPAESATADRQLPLEIVGVQTARRVLLGSETRFQVMLRGAPGPARKFRLTITDEGKEVHEQDVNIPQDAGEVQVPVAFRPQEAGLKRYQFHVVPAGAAAAKPAEAAPSESDDSGYAVNMQVVADKHELLILADKWRWDFKFLRRVLEDDPHFSFTAMLSRGDKAFAQFGEPERKVSLGGYPQTRQELEWFDTIILEDVDPTRWPKGLAAGLSRAVVDDGKSLVVIAGTNLGKFTERPELASLLPVEIGANAGVPVEGPIDVQVSGDGTRSAFFFQPAGSALRDAASPFPALDQVYPTLRKRPAAAVLLEAVRHSTPTGNGLIVIAEQTVGRGRVLFIGTDNLWKWQTQGTANDEGVTIYQQFWQQALRALAPVRAGAGGVHVWLQPDKSRYESGARVLLRSEVQSDRPLPAFKLEASVVLPNGRQLPLVLAPDTDNPQQFVAEFETSLVGRYRLAATAKSDGKPIADVSTAIEVQAAPSETNGRPVDTAQMARIASATGGKVISAGDSATWPEAGDATIVPQRVTIDLWSNFTLLIALTSLLGADWMLRLARGYV